eukprot:TRINITY_DN968_c0_g1_i1.p1 TRINITY_DN968_c0_g1~~TRINITY_DN968_c0_g1_i1.p1  ORF type:complete len:822 (+),score=104.17 TRINITY_DN968_c0_g1_i1:28-2466(+)
MDLKTILLLSITLEALLWTAEGTTTVQENPSIYDEKLSTINIIIISVAGAGVLGLTVFIGCKATHGQVHAATLVFGFVGLAVIIAGASWAVTVTGSREVIRDHAAGLLWHSAQEVSERLCTELNLGFGLMHTIALSYQRSPGNANVLSGWNVSNMYYRDLMATIGSQSTTIENIYSSTPDGVFAGIGRWTEMDYIVLIGYSSVDDETLLPRNMSCEEGCNSKVPSLLTYIVPSDSLDLEFSSIHEQLPWSPLERCWYYDVDKESDVPKWSGVYVFEGAQRSTGITLSLPIRVAGKGFAGIAAIDYSTASLAPILSQLPPTANSVIHVATLNLILVSTSLPTSDLVLEVGTTQADLYKDTINITSARRGSRLRSPFDTVLNRFKTMEEASKQSAILKAGSDIVLLYPIEIKGGLRLVMTISLPYSDVMGKADTASTTALLLAVAISIFCGALMYVGVEFLLRPLQGLATDMNEVAWMRLDAVYLEKNLSAIYEIAWMQKSFKLMVRNLMEYKEYLPQTVLLDENDEETPSPSPDTVQPFDNEKATKSSSSKSLGMFRPVQGLMKRNVTLMAVNVKRFNVLSLASGFAEAFETYLGVIVETTSVYDGIIDRFNGDKVFSHFNVARTSVRHRVNSVKCAGRVRTSLKETCSFRDVNFGISGGEALCGDVGCKTLRKHCVIGFPATVVAVIERLGCKHDISIACCGEVAGDTFKVFEHRAAAIIKLNHHRPVVAYEIAGRAPTDDEQWLYEQQTGDRTSPAHAAYNTAFILMWEGRHREALAALSNSHVPDKDLSLRKQIEAYMRTNEVPKPPTFC